VVVSLWANNETVAQHVYFFLPGDVKEMDQFFGGMHEFEESDTLSFTAKGSDEFSVVYYLKISHQGILPER
jgi:hypothetical protein